MIQCSLDLLTFSVLNTKSIHENGTQHETKLSGEDSKLYFTMLKSKSFISYSTFTHTHINTYSDIKGHLLKFNEFRMYEITSGTGTIATNLVI